MFKNSTIWRSIHAAWELTCDLPMIAPLRPDAVDKKLDKHSFDEFNPLYFMPVLGAAAGILALIAGRVFSYLLPVNGSSILFALVVIFAGELRTSGRALALNVTFFENICGRRKFVTARELRNPSLKNITGLVAMLLAIGMLFGKFFCVMLIARTGHYGVLSMAMVITLGAEALLASEASAVGVPRYCSNARGEYIVALVGFLLLFNLIVLPLATLITVTAAIILTTCMTVLYLKRCGEVDSDDMTMTGYLLEFTVWAVMALLIG